MAEPRNGLMRVNVLMRREHLLDDSLPLGCQPQALRTQILTEFFFRADGHVYRAEIVMSGTVVQNFSLRVISTVMTNSE